MKSGREHTLINFEGNKLNTATIEDLIFQINGVKDLQFQITKNKKITNEKLVCVYIYIYIYTLLSLNVDLLKLDLAESRWT